MIRLPRSGSLWATKRSSQPPSIDSGNPERLDDGPGAQGRRSAPDGRVVSFKSGSIEPGETQTVFNLDVAVSRNFFVGHTGLLVHDFSFRAAGHGAVRPPCGSAARLRRVMPAWRRQPLEPLGAQRLRVESAESCPLGSHRSREFISMFCTSAGRDLGCDGRRWRSLDTEA